MHLTNFNINQHHEDFTNKREDAEKASRRTFLEVMQIIAESHPDGEEIVTKLKRDIHDI